MSISGKSALGFVVGSAAILGAIFTGLQYFATTSASLHAVVRGFPHHHVINWSEQRLDKRQLIESATRFDELSSDTNRIGGVYEIFIINEGNEVARNVLVEIDNSLGMAVSRREDTSIIVGDKASLGNLTPDAEVNIVAWTTRNAKLYRSIDPPISITHDKGLAEIDNRYEIEGVLRFVHRNSLHVMLLIALWAVAVTTPFIIWIGSLNRAKREDGSSSGNEKSDKSVTPDPE